MRAPCSGRGMRGPGIPPSLSIPRSSPIPGALCVRSVARALAEQRAGGLLEDPAAGAGLLPLGAIVLHHLAHGRGGDLDAVARADLAVLVVALRQLPRH